MSIFKCLFLKLASSSYLLQTWNVYKKDLSFKWCYLLNYYSAFIFHFNVHLLSSTFWHMLILHQSLIPVSICDIWPLQILKVSSQTIQTVPLTMWVNIFIEKHIYKKRKKKKRSLWMVIFNMLEQYIAMSNIFFANMDTGCSMKCCNIPENCYWTLLNLFVVSVTSICNLIRTIKLSTWPCPL